MLREQLDVKTARNIIRRYKRRGNIEGAMRVAKRMNMKRAVQNLAISFINQTEKDYKNREWPTPYEESGRAFVRAALIARGAGLNDKAKELKQEAIKTFRKGADWYNQCFINENPPACLGLSRVKKEAENCDGYASQLGAIEWKYLNVNIFKDSEDL